MLLPRPLVLVLKTGIMNKTRGSRFPIHSKEGSKFYSWKSNWKCMNYFTEIKCILRNKLRTPCCCCLGLIEIKLPGYFHEAVSSWSDSFLLSLIVTFFWMIDANKSESLQQWSCYSIPRFSIFSFHLGSWSWSLLRNVIVQGSLTFVIPTLNWRIQLVTLEIIFSYSRSQQSTN